ncbi:hypothetical protein [Hymenobacter cellulosilyticus]|nr:hypothetical protein [Hymenobacter cellulosilyticus]
MRNRVPRCPAIIVDTPCREQPLNINQLAQPLNSPKVTHDK